MITLLIMIQKMLYATIAAEIFLRSFVMSHKTKKLSGEFGGYCALLCTLRNCDECRWDFSLTLKCKHFGKKGKVTRNVYYSNKAANVSSGPSKYVKCGYCSDYYMRGFSGGNACYLKQSDSFIAWLFQ